MSSAIESIAAERARQIEKGWTPEHDDEHSTNHLVNRAITYAHAGRYEAHLERDLLRDQLVKAAALLVAAIERLDRATGHTDRSE